MQCNLARPLACLLVLLASATTARNAHAVVACTAAQVIASEGASCPSGTGPCTISKNYDVATGCILDFGTRVVSVTGTIDFASNSITIKAGTFTVAAGGKLQGLGDQNTAPRNNGGKVRIETTGAVNVNHATNQGRIDVSANLNGGDIVIVAGGAVTIGGQLRARNLDTDTAGGVIDITSAVSVVTQSTALVDATGGELGFGGSMTFNANGGNVDLGALADLRGGDGGDLTVFATGQAIVRDVNISANGDAGSAGSIDILAQSVQLLGLFTATGSVAALGEGGGDGGDVTIEAEFGNITMSGDILAEGAGEDGGGGTLDIIAIGNFTQSLGSDMSARANGTFGFGGAIDIDVGIAFSSSGVIDASGGDVGGDIFILSGRDATFNNRVDITGRNAGSYGGTLFVEAGVEGKGNVVVNERLDAGGGACSVERGCGVAGSIEIEGCDVTIGTLAEVRSRAPTAGTIELTSREQLRVQGEVTATTNDAGANGSNTYRYRSAKPPIVTGTVTPTGINLPLLTCSATVTVGCLRPCPTCGNAIVEYPETCDNNNGTPVSCDGCSAVCKTENCNDGNGCTADSCDPTLGCNHSSVIEGTSCSDGNLCNGPDVCHFGVCTSSTPLNCNDNNVCTTDSCVPATGCAHVNNGLGCNDGLFCNGLDVCSGGTCSLHTTNPCAGPDGDSNCAESCNEATDSCTAADPNGSACSDAVFCNGADTCNAGTCALHAGNPCPGPDGDGNCAESCDEAGDACTAPDPNGSACTDGLFCTGADACSGGSCAVHAGDPCPGADGDGNCSESCNETADNCTAPDPDGSTCTDGLFCTGTDTCGGGGCASHTGDPCPGADGDGNCSESCNETADNCTAPDPNGSTCIDGLFCNGTDTCNGGSCSSHTGAPCPGPDGDADCVESCNEATDTCDANDPNGSPCSDGECHTGVCSETTTTTTSTTTTTTSTTTTSTTSTTIPAAVGHLKCYKMKDPRAKAAYTVDLLAAVGGFPNESGCTVKLGAKQICVEVNKQSVSPPPPGTGPVSPPNAGSVFISYKLKCPKQTVPSTVRVDQFGVGQFTVGQATELLVPASPGPANDHFKCYKARDSRGKTSYTMNLIAGVSGFTNEFGCSIKLGASRVCVQVTKQNVVPAPPGGGPGPGPGSGAKFVGYKLKCPKQPVPGGSFTDQFGSGTFAPTKPATLLVPAS